MKDVRDTWCIQIEITNKCEKQCSNCTHLVSYCKLWEIDLEIFEQALQSLQGWPKVIGIIGGNTVLHSNFLEVTKLMECYVPDKSKRGVWLSTWGKYGESFIRDKYGYINFNPHNEIVMHQPILISSKDMIPNEKLRKELISNCWLAEQWSPSITPKGVYRCEVMGCMDMALDINLGKPITTNWWNQPLNYFQDQIDTFCHLCGICVPYTERRDIENMDDISESNQELFTSRISNRKANIVNHHDYDYYEYKDKNLHPEKYIVRLRK